ncbi:MAG: hypothetical protein LBH32_04070 [Dysgonamonadaceae bacterium]|jgi:hypothetical protein|nr:hypothetical protein [Dysgonamonadaceae bacterium]
MKQIVAIIVMALFVVTSVSYAQTQKEIKQVEKEAKKEAKEKEKSGWKLLEPGSLETVVKTHLLKSRYGNMTEIVGTANMKKSINLGKTTARNNAVNEYAEGEKSMVKGKITSGIIDLNENQIENLAGGFERRVVAEISGELRLSYTLYKQNKDGSYDVQTIYLVDIEAEAKAKKRAMQLALEEAELASKYGDAISKFIDGSFQE